MEFFDNYLILKSPQSVYIEADNVVIENLTLENVNFKGDGVVVYFAKSDRAINCNFVNNTASKYDGGAVYFRGSGAVENCNFTNNSAKYGGAVHFWDTGYMTNCNFTNQITWGCGAV